MKHESKWVAASMFALCASLSGTSAAQSPTEEPAPEVAPAPAPTQPDMNPVQTGVSTPAPIENRPGPMQATSISPSEDRHKEVVEHTWPNRPLLLTGAVLLAGSYGASAIVGATSDREADEKLFLPVVGPWLDLKSRDCEVNACGSDGFNKAMLIADGAVQGLGAVSVLLSLVLPESRQKPWYLIGNDSLSVAPQVGTTTTGLRAVGHF